MIQLGGLASIMYTSSLSLHFLLGIRYRWLPSQLKKIDPIIQLACIFVPLLSAVLGLIATVYNPTPFFACFIQDYPMGCEFDTTDENKCIRGDNASMYALFMVQIPILLGLFFIAVAMVMIYCSVRRQEERVSRYSFEASDNRRMSRETLWNAFRYTLGFFVSWVPTAIVTILILGMGLRVPFAVRVVQSLLSTSQGFVNAIVYSADLRSHLKSFAQSLVKLASSGVPLISEEVNETTSEDTTVP